MMQVRMPLLAIHEMDGICGIHQDSEERALRKDCALVCIMVGAKGQPSGSIMYRFIKKDFLSLPTEFTEKI